MVADPDCRNFGNRLSFGYDNANIARGDLYLSLCLAQRNAQKRAALLPKTEQEASAQTAARRTGRA